MVTAQIGEKIINCYDGKYSKEELKTWAGKNIIKCPVCGQPYEYCHGLINTPYFRHKDKAECEYAYAEAETEEHVNGKIALYEWIRKQKGVTNAILEAWLPDTKQRPDIMFEYDGKKYVIEYQCSPISTEFLERHHLYQAGGIEDIWICGTEKYMQEGMRIKEIEKGIHGYYSVQTGLFYFQNTHLGYSKSLRHLFYEINLENVMGLQDPIDEKRNCKHSPYHCCYLDNINFKNGQIIIKQFDNIDELTESIVIKQQKRNDRKIRDKIAYDKKLSNFVTFMRNRMSKILNKDMWDIYADSCVQTGDNYVVVIIKFILTKYGYNSNEIAFQDKLYLENSIYASANRVIKTVENIVNETSMCEKSIDKGLRYFTRKPNLNIYIVPSDARIEDRKFYCLCKGKSTVTEFEMLLDLIRVLNISQRYSNYVYIKLPNTIKLLFGNIYTYTDKNEIKAYFERLGFQNVYMEN